MKKDSTVRNAFIISITIFLLLAIVSIFGFSRYYTIYNDQRRQDAVNGITPIISDYVDKLDLFGTIFYDENITVTDQEFADFAILLIDGDESIEYIYFSPNGDIANVYPENSSLIGETVVIDFTLEEFSRFSNAIANDNFFLTYVYMNDELQKIELNKSIVVDNQFSGLVTIVVDVNKLIDVLPYFEQDDEIVIATEDNVFLKASPIYNEDSFRDSEINIDGVVFTISTDFYGEDYVQSILMIMFIVFLLTIPLLIVFMFLLENKKKIKSFIREIEYSQNFSIETGLKNSKSLYKDVEKLIIDKDEFFLALGIFNNVKYINDNYGHSLGDELILEAVNLIKGVLRSNTELYHFGGDQYVFIIRTENKGEVKNILKRVLKVFDREIVIDRIRTNISMTLGVVGSSKQGGTVDEMIKNAHLTLSNSHILNSNAYSFYKKEYISNLLINRDFDHFVKNLNLELFEVYLMPIISVETNIIVGFECLTRAFNEFDEVLDTETVINSLERNGRIQELDEIVFKKMILLMRRINIEYPDNDYFLSVNASAISFNENYVNKVIELYELEHFSRGTIVLELTESYQVEDYNYLIRLFDKLNNVGIKTAIDDFGSGYSSLSYISKFPIYAIKIDKEYVCDFLENDFNRTLFMTLKSIAEVLDCKLVAEGVDDPETLDFLKKNGCQLYQGYLFSKGVTFEDSLKMIKKNIKEYSEE